MSNFVANVCEVVKGEFRDYEVLKQYHYIDTDPVCLRGIWKVRAKFPFTNSFPDPLAVIVYMVPIREWTTRNIATDNYFLNWPRGGLRQSVVNRKVTYLARIIVDPRFHKQGIASYLLGETLKLQDVPLIETMTPIDFTSSMFVKVGFKLYFQPTPERYTRCQNAFLSVGISRELWHVPETVQFRIDSLSKHPHAFIHKEIKTFIHTFHHHEYMTPGLDRTKFLLSKIIYPNAYLLWKNPRVSLLPYSAK
jgi:GNAT superfamily N-acetyltransferase